MFYLVFLLILLQVHVIIATKQLSGNHDLSVKGVSNEVSSTGEKMPTICCRKHQDKQAILPPHIGYKKVLLTGGAGFIGSHVAEYLLERGDDVVILDELNEYYNASIKEQNLNILKQKCNYDDQMIDEKNIDSVIAAKKKHRKEKKKCQLSIYCGDISDKEFMEKD